MLVIVAYLINLGLLYLAKQFICGFLGMPSDVFFCCVIAIFMTQETKTTEA